MITLKHDTTEYEINSATKADLEQALGSSDFPHVRQCRGLKKAELVEIARGEIARLAARHAEEQAAAKAAHDAQVEAEKNDPLICAAVAGLKTGFVKQFESHVAKRNEIAARIAGEGENAADWMDDRMISNGETLMYEAACVRALARLAQADWSEMTADELLAEVQKQADYETRELIRSTEYRHNSTGSLDNVANIQKFKAQQLKVSVLRQAAEVFAKDLKTARAGGDRFDCEWFVARCDRW